MRIQSCLSQNCQNKPLGRGNLAKPVGLVQAMALAETVASAQHLVLLNTELQHMVSILFNRSESVMNAAGRRIIALVTLKGTT